MVYLVDTNVFIKAIPENIFQAACICSEKGKEITITETILNELEPGDDKVQADSSIKTPFIMVDNLVKGTMAVKNIKLISIKSIPGAEKEYVKLRRSYYSWMTDTKYLRELISEGKITPAEIKAERFKNRDKGECELIAVALTAPGEYTIVSDDYGKVYLHPYQNIFKDYAIPKGVRVICSDEWKKEIGLE